MSCAKAERRHKDCSSLVMCAEDATTHHDFLRATFPSNFIRVASSRDEMQDMLLRHNSTKSKIPSKDTCNVIASDRLVLLEVEDALNVLASEGRTFVLEKGTEFKDPLAVVTRNDDREFSDVVNWVVQALFYGAEQGLGKNPSLCQTHANLTPNASDLNFISGVYCVGNYYEIWRDEANRGGMNQINRGTGMVYAIPFGELEGKYGDPEGADIPPGTLLGDIRGRELLNCGVVVPNDFDAAITRSNRGLVGMSADYCRALAAALFNGDTDLVNFTAFSETDNSSFAALNEGSVHVLAGARVKKKYDFVSSPSPGGVHFSTPYFYGSESVG